VVVPALQLAESAPVPARRIEASGADEVFLVGAGTRVLARAGASIELRESGDNVECRLVLGELLVHVPTGSLGSFAVVTAARRVEVTGTVFGVSAGASGETAVTVWDGHVRVLGAGMSENLEAGDNWPPEAQPLLATGADMRLLAASGRVSADQLTADPTAAEHSAAEFSAAEHSPVVPDPAHAGTEKPRARLRPAANPDAPRPNSTALVDELYSRARKREALGERLEAARLYESAASEGGATSEAAAFAAARLYGGLGDSDSVRRVLSGYRSRHPSGLYARAADVLWLRALMAEGDSAGVEREAERFLRSYPDDPRAPQFRAARALERARRGRCVEARADLAGVEAEVVERVDELCPLPSRSP